MSLWLVEKSQRRINVTVDAAIEGAASWARLVPFAVTKQRATSAISKEEELCHPRRTASIPTAVSAEGEDVVMGVA